MTTREILMTQGFGESLSRFDEEKVSKVLEAKNVKAFMEAVKAIGDELLYKEAEEICNEFKFVEYVTGNDLSPLERYPTFNMYLKFNVRKRDKRYINA